jgi:hypothetical protein
MKKQSSIDIKLIKNNVMFNIFILIVEYEIVEIKSELNWKNACRREEANCGNSKFFS